MNTSSSLFPPRRRPTLAGSLLANARFEGATTSVHVKSHSSLETTFDMHKGIKITIATIATSRKPIGSPCSHRTKRFLGFKALWYTI